MSRPSRRSPGISRRGAWTALLVSGLGLLVGAMSGCPFSFEKEEIENVGPTTFFLVQQPDTSFSNELFYNWDGTDPDSDVVAYQYQLVLTDEEYYFSGGASGNVLESIDPRDFSGEENWSDRVTDVARTFPNLEDGAYELRVRAIDSEGVVDPNPAVDRVFVYFDDIAPVPVILFPTTGRITSPVVEFIFDASDESRSQTTPREILVYSYRLFQTQTSICSPTEHSNDPPEPFRRFPAGGLPITATGSSTTNPPSQYNNLATIDCRWTFEVTVRDPAGNTGEASFEVTQVGN